LPDLYGQSSKELLNCILRLVSPISLVIGFMVLISDSKLWLGWEPLPLYGCYYWVEIIRFLMIKIVLSCRLSKDVSVFSVCGHLCIGCRIAPSLRRSVHGWRLRREILFPYMGGSIICGLVIHLLHRRSTISHAWYIFHLFTLVFVVPWDTRQLCTLVMQRPGVIAWLSNKAPIIKKIMYLTKTNYPFSGRWRFCLFFESMLPWFHLWWDAVVPCPSLNSHERILSKKEGQQGRQQ
jgi:hypothetical protein